MAIYGQVGCCCQRKNFVGSPEKSTGRVDTSVRENSHSNGRYLAVTIFKAVHDQGIRRSAMKSLRSHSLPIAAALAVATIWVGAVGTARTQTGRPVAKASQLKRSIVSPI